MHVEHLKLTPILAFRLGLTTELNIAKGSQIEIFDQDYIQKIIQQRSKVINQRDGMLKGMVVILFSFFLLTYGASFKLPYLDISLREVPAIHEFMAAIISVQFLLIVWNFYIDQCYSSITDCYSGHVSKDIVDPTVFSASMSEDTIIFNLFNTHSHRKLGEGLVISKYGKVMLFLALKTVAISINLLIFGAMVSFCYLIYLNYQSSELNIFVTVYSMMNIVFVFFLMFTLSQNYEYEVVPLRGEKLVVSNPVEK